MSDEPFGDRMERVLRKRLRRVTLAGPEAFERGRPAALHALRLAVKALRYDTEFVVPIVRERATEPLRLLALLQERLGAIEDAASFARTYDALRAALSEDDPRCAGIETLRRGAARDGERALAEARRIWYGDTPTAGAGSGSYPERLAASISAALGSLSPNADP